MARIAGAVSVVVPTRDRPDALATCLAALSAQVPPLHEVVVVDDGSTDRAAVARVVADASNARVVRADGGGPAAARNRGVAATSGEWVLLTDDDCRPGPGWAASLGARLRSGATVVAGPTVAGPGSRPPVLAAQVITNHLVLASLHPSGTVVGFAPTCNLGASATFLERLPFDESYPLAAGEDRDWCDRVASEGIPIGWVADAWVTHHPDLELPSFWRQQVRYGRGAYRFRTEAARARPRPPVRFYADLLRRGFGAGIRVGVLVSLAQVATAVGVVREARRPVSDR